MTSTSATMTTDDVKALLTVLDEAQISQREFAKMVGVSRVSVNRWAAGLAVPSPAIGRLVTDVVYVLQVAITEGLLPGNLPQAHGKTVEERWEMLQDIFTKAHRIANKR